MTPTFSESTVEHATLDWLQAVGWNTAHGSDIAPDPPPAAERGSYAEVVLPGRLRRALQRLNPHLPAEALDDAFRQLARPDGTDLVQRNRTLHRLISRRHSCRIPRSGRLHPRRPGPGPRLRPPRVQRLACRQPVHGHREQTHAPPGRRALR